MITLLGAAGAGFLVWLATQVSEDTNGGYWAVYGLIAAAGLVMAFSQILGGWTKWGWPRLSVNVFLLGFLPVLITAGWVLVATQPEANWLRDHVRGYGPFGRRRRAASIPAGGTVTTADDRPTTREQIEAEEADADADARERDRETTRTT
jgi:drug/metabolite transporter superfamily protein YnfA